MKIFQKKVLSQENLREYVALTVVAFESAPGAKTECAAGAKTEPCECCRRRKFWRGSIASRQWSTY